MLPPKSGIFSDHHLLDRMKKLIYPLIETRYTEEGLIYMELLNQNISRKPVRALLFDFDGTISTLRCGWEQVMRPLMIETIGGGTSSPELERMVDEYIDESTGIQTIYQMQWLAEHAAEGLPTDPWWYKDEYNRRLMEMVEKRKEALFSGRANPEEYLMSGAVDFLKEMKKRGVKMYVASGTDHPDVLKEAEALGVIGYFDEIAGAPVREMNCSKEAVLKRLIEQYGLTGDEVAVIGDGKVEIALGKAAGARTIGLATDEQARRGVSEIKRERLVKAGADVISGDFEAMGALLHFLGLEDDTDRNREGGQLKFDNITTYTSHDRVNLVRIDTLKNVTDEVPEWNFEGFDELIDRIIEARRNGKPVIWSQGAHVIKCGLSRYLIALMKEGIITHIAGNGACSIHDFELAYLGGTSEHVPTAIEDGSFGMWEETGRWMNEAIKEGARLGLGYGEALGRYVDAHPRRFPYREDCVFYQAYRLGIPATYHIALGTDIIHQHPTADFAAIGAASGVDFHKFCHSVSLMDGGVYLNFGSGVIGPEVFLKALSIARNLHYETFRITTGNFDLIDLGDYKRPLGYEHPQYYYRPRKNIINRPVSQGGKGWHFCGDHQETIPNLYKKVLERK